MTCIAAVVERGQVTMGADSAGVDGWSLVIRKDAKIFSRGEFLIGFTTSFRMGQLLRHTLKLPPLPARASALNRYMVVDFVNALRACFKDHGWSTTKDGQELAGTFLVGVRGRLFTINGDYQVGESRHAFSAVGCGADLALGAMFASENLRPRRRVLLALRAAEHGSAGVRGPFLVEQT
ncbi:MAG: hypothetical protein Q8K32_31425 [Archangium sp.]|nr:hypothetical protein [Archangium sp.]